jgi:proline dehydrogenase
MLSRLLARSVTLLPKGVVARIAGRYIAGEDLATAVHAARHLCDEGCGITLNNLGENINSPADAEAMRDDYLASLRAVADNKLRGGISVKLSGLGLGLDPELCRSLLDQVLEAAREAGRFVRVDMEESRWTDATLDLVVDARRRGHRVGTVIQARLRRSPDDIERLIKEDVPIRLVKGIYVESEAIAFTSQQDIRAAYGRLLSRLLEARADIAIATHDDELVGRALSLLQPDARAEFQQLLGVRTKLRQRLIAEGHRVRVYVPFGSDWYGYSTRRLTENPRMALLITRALFLPEREGPAGSD